MIEQAKQRALFGKPFSHKVSARGVIQNWTDADQATLQTLVWQWNPKTGLEGLNAIIDPHLFSDGSHTEVLSR